ncbi:hypothetical protein ACI3RH_08820, partial [Lactococcus lactis]
VSIQNGIGGSLGELAIVFGFGAMLGTLEELVSETNQNRKQYALLFPAQEVKIPLCAYLLTRISPLI